MAFDNISDGDNTRLERIPKRAGKIVSGAIKGTVYATILSELGWESLQARRERRKLIYLPTSSMVMHLTIYNRISPLPPPHPSSLELRTVINCEIGQTSVNSTHELKLLEKKNSHPQLTIGTPQTRQLKI